jgi:hypothetical protein
VRRVRVTFRVSTTLVMEVDDQQRITAADVSHRGQAFDVEGVIAS